MVGGGAGFSVCFEVSEDVSAIAFFDFCCAASACLAYWRVCLLSVGVAWAAGHPSIFPKMKLVIFFILVGIFRGFLPIRPAWGILSCVLRRYGGFLAGRG